VEISCEVSFCFTILCEPFHNVTVNALLAWSIKEEKKKGSMILHLVLDGYNTFKRSALETCYLHAGVAFMMVMLRLFGF
jgi:hypothetical protein